MKKYELLKVQDDAVVVKEGATERLMHKILSGKVAVYINYGLENEFIVEILSEQRCFGEITVLTGKPSLYTFVAIGEVLLMKVPEEFFDDFVQNNSWNAITIMKNLAHNVVTLRFNLNLLVEELANVEDSPTPIKIREITGLLRQYCNEIDKNEVNKSAEVSFKV